MKNNPKFSLLMSLIVLLGIPLCLLLIILITENWRYFYWSLEPCLTVFVIGLFVSLSEYRKIKMKGSSMT
ncbi:hypothetical protein JOD45_003219 [Scopulibacillus daqui]|uniref:Uncharacterized protein n=1 Tax=Scopulibacillus daqui TaxID=1469162 RepID=A0ABS2Q5L0_9BACL|nr:hypothetical protein [Scopulibacillus daqui]